MKKFTKAALIADALNLGPHWIYNQERIARLYPNGVTTFTDPASQYHGSKKAGDFTHTGDQLLFLHRTIQKNDNSYTEDKWRSYWVDQMSRYTGYLDNATKTTLSTGGQSPSQSDEVSGAARIAPILDLELTLEETIAAARSQTALTHDNLEVIELAEFIVRTVFAIKAGADFHSALSQAADEQAYQKLSPKLHLEAALNANKADHLKAAANLGLTCHFPEAFPLTLYYALHFEETFEQCISMNALAGGDNTARGIILALFFAARDGVVADHLFPALTISANSQPISIAAGTNTVEIAGNQGKLSGSLEIPEGDVLATAIFAHCFTCGKDFLPEKSISQKLAKRGIATLRIDFSGIGYSEGAFSESSFLTNLDDLVVSADWLSQYLTAPSLLVGHSLGGAAVLAASQKTPSVKAVATIGAPSDPAHVTHLFESHLPEIETKGEAEITLAGRSFTIGKRFLDDLASHNQTKALNSLDGIATLIMHSPEDEIVPLKNAGSIYSSLPHPKSFIALAGADHLLTAERDVEYVADIIATWAFRNLDRT